ALPLTSLTCTETRSVATRSSVHKFGRQMYAPALEDVNELHAEAYSPSCGDARRGMTLDSTFIHTFFSRAYTPDGGIMRTLLHGIFLFALAAGSAAAADDL